MKLLPILVAALLCVHSARAEDKLLLDIKEFYITEYPPPHLVKVDNSGVAYGGPPDGSEGKPNPPDEAPDTVITSDSDFVTASDSGFDTASDSGFVTASDSGFVTASDSGFVTVPLSKDPVVVRERRNVSPTPAPEASTTVGSGDKSPPTTTVPCPMASDVAAQPNGEMSVPIPCALHATMDHAMPAPAPVSVAPQMVPANAVVAEEQPNRCDLGCTKFDLNPVCATKGDCLHEFANQCVLDTFNCLHPHAGFVATNDEKCSMHWLNKCTEQDMQN